MLVTPPHTPCTDTPRTPADTTIPKHKLCVLPHTLEAPTPPPQLQPHTVHAQTHIRSHTARHKDTPTRATHTRMRPPVHTHSHDPNTETYTHRLPHSQTLQTRSTQHKPTLSHTQIHTPLPHATGTSQDAPTLTNTHRLLDFARVRIPCISFVQNHIPTSPF